MHAMTTVPELRTGTHEFAAGDRPTPAGGVEASCPTRSTGHSAGSLPAGHSASHAVAVGAGVRGAGEDDWLCPEADVPGAGPPAPGPEAARSRPPCVLSSGGAARARAV